MLIPRGGGAVGIAPQELVIEVLQQSRFFRPDGRLIKQRMEHLIGQRYARREDPMVHTSPYVYVPRPTLPLPLPPPPHTHTPAFSA